MRKGASDVPSRGLRGRLRHLGARLKKARRAQLRDSVLEWLEPRTLLAVLPAPQMTDSLAGVSTTGGNVSSPQVVVDRYNPMHLVSVWTRNDPDLDRNTTIVEGSYSNDGGQNWTRFNVAGALRRDQGLAPSTDDTRYTQTMNVSTAFDAEGNFYVLSQQSNASNTSGALILTKFNFNGSTPVQQFDQIVHQYVTDPVFNPTLMVDDNQESFIDPLTEAEQSDPYSGNVWIAWSTSEAAPTGDYFTRPGLTWNPNSIQVISSSDGGQSFSGAYLLNGSTNVGSAWGRYTNSNSTFANATPKIAVGQGRPGTVGGVGTIVWDNFGLANADFDLIQASTLTGGATTRVSGPTGPINQAIVNAEEPNTPQSTEFSVNVALDPRFTNLSKLTADLVIEQGDMSILAAVLVMPDGRQILLFSNARNAFGDIPDGQLRGVEGENLGIVGEVDGVAYGLLGATFDDQAARSINDRSGEASGYTSTYRTEGIDLPAGGYLSLSALQGLPASELNGTWTLRITAFRTNGADQPAPQLRDFGLNFTSGMEFVRATPTSPVVSNVATTLVRGNQSGNYSRASAAAGPQGIGPGVAIARDNTLGSFSVNQGRIYVTYVGYARYESGGYVNPADNTDIYLAVSDDGGFSWFNPLNVGPGARGVVNDDNGATDGFSGANNSTIQYDQFGNPYFTGQISGRAQFLPQVAVDQTTGTLALSWRDGRDDSSRARSSIYVGVSIDGGASFSEQSYANPPQISTDAITGEVLALSPQGDNFSAVNPAATTYGFGVQMGLTIGSGQLYVAWAGNYNQSYLEDNSIVRGYTFQAYVQRLTVAAGPRVIDSTMGPVGQPGDLVNTSRSPDGAPLANAFEVTFDRPIDPQELIAAGLATFTPEDVLVYYKGTRNDSPFIPLKVLDVSPVPSSAVGNFGYTQFRVTFDPRYLPNDNTSGLTTNFVGTYSYILRPTITDQIRIVTAGGVRWGNEADQNANGIAGQDPLTTAYTGLTPGDAYVAPMPKRITPAVFGPDPLSLLTTPFSTMTLPLVVPGAHLADTWTDYSTGPGVPLLNEATSSLYVRFDRQMDAASFTAAEVLQLMSPAGSLLAPQYFGSDSVGLPIPAPTSPTTPGTVLSKLTVPSYDGTFFASDISVTINLAFPVASALSVDLIAPDGTTLRLFSGVGANGSNFVNTTFSDSAPRSITSVGAGDAPFTGTFRPAGSGGLAVFNGKSIEGEWKLRVVNERNLTVGVVNNWSLNVKPVISVRSVTPVDGLTHTFAIDFPKQSLSGTYTVQLASSIQDSHGQPLDANLNAGVDALRGQAVNVPTTTVSFGSGTVNRSLVDNRITSTINVAQNFPIQGVTASGRTGLRVQISLATPNVNPLTARLIYHPDTAGERSVVLFSGLIQGPNTGGFVNAILDDAANTPISQSAPPFFGGPYNPQSPLLNAAGFLDMSSGGTWQLEIESSGGTTAVLNSWSLLFERPLPTTGLGEPVVDRANTSFRIFQVDPANPLSRNTWTSVGPAAVVGSAGRIGALAQDPSDSTGNTFFIGGASGGVWKTTNFLTTDPQGPTYIPLTDFGPSSGLNIGGIAVFPRNDDPNQSIVIASTGEGDTGSTGVGFLISRNGGATWQLLDSTNNVGADGNPLPIESALRDRAFVGSTSFKVLVDPRPTLQGETIIYAALSGRNGGLWRSVDTGDTWELMRSGNATDVALDPSSATGGGTDPNLRIIYAAFAGEGVFLSPNRGQVWNLMTGGVGNPLIVDTFDDSNVAVANLGVNPNGSRGRIVLAKPALTASAIANQIYAGWLYAAVSNSDGSFGGLYMTKDFGQNWVLVRIPTEPTVSGFAPAIPSNNIALGDYNVTNGFGNISISLAIDPTNPNVVYLGGYNPPSTGTGMIRVDATKVWDAHNLTLFSAVDGSGGIEYNSVGPVTPGNLSDGWFTQGDYLNYIRNPLSPFETNATRFVRNLNQFTNNGFGAEWIPFDAPLNPSGGTSPNYHRLLTMLDPVTGLTRLVYGTNRGVWSVLDDDGVQKTERSVGTTPTPDGNRNGNLQIAQFYYGAVQPNNNGTALSIHAALFYGSSNDGSQMSHGVILNDGILEWNRLLNAGANAGGVAVDPQGKGTLYQAFQPGSMVANMGTTFFRVNDIGRTFGLFQQSGGSDVPDPQWAAGPGATFAVNPLDGQQLIISSGVGRIFSSNNQGGTWLRIGEPSVFGDPSGYSQALAFGAPDPSAPGGIGNLGNFLYVGTTGGRLFLSRTGGGGDGNSWLEASAGLDGSPIQRIVPSPVRGSHAAYAVTTTGVFFIRDSVALAQNPANPANAWVDVTGDVFELGYRIFGQSYDQATDPNGIKLSHTVALNALAVDWRYSIPNVPGDQTGSGFHPVLYVSGNAGVFRSIDNGQSWTQYPNQEIDGSAVQGGYLPAVEVTDLDLSLGAINPDTGVPNLLGPLDPYVDPNNRPPGDPDLLLASTWGRGMFAIKMAPLTIPGTVRVESADTDGTAPDGTPIVTTSRFRVSGLSMTTAFNNATRITIFDETDDRIIGGFNIADLGTNVSANWTDSFGNFTIQINAGAIPTNGLKVLKIYATDDAGAVGNAITLAVTLDADDLGDSQVPADPSLSLFGQDNTGLVPSQNYTNRPDPRFVGVTSPGASVELQYWDGTAFLSFVPALTTVAGADGSFALTFPSVGDGTFVVRAVASNAAGPADNPSPMVTVRIKTAGPTAPPTFVLDAAYDSGIVGDDITNVRKPLFVGSIGAENGGSVIRIYQAGPTGAPVGQILVQTTADASGNYRVQLPLSLNNGVIRLVATAIDAAGNVAPGNSGVLPLSIITTGLDYSGSSVDAGYGGSALSQSQSTLYLRNDGIGFGQWFTHYTPPSYMPSWFPNGATVGVASDIPLAGDFDGDGKYDLATFRQSDATWVVWRSTLGGLVFQFGTPGVSLPVVGSFDTPGATQYGVYEVVGGNGLWKLTTASGSIREFGFGVAGDVPLVGDFLGLGTDQPAVYRPSTGQFLVYSFATATFDVVATLPANQIPVPGKYDNEYFFGVGQAYRTIPAVFDPVYGVFTIARPAGSTYASQVVFWGGDIPVPGDYAGVGWDLPAVYRPSTGQFLVKWDQRDPNSVNAQMTAFPTAVGAPIIPVGAPLAYRTLSTTSLIVGALPSTQTIGATAFSASASALSAKTASFVVQLETTTIDPVVATSYVATPIEVPAPQVAVTVNEPVDSTILPTLVLAATNAEGVGQPWFEGTAAPGTVLALRLSGAGAARSRLVGSVTIDATGRYSFQLPSGVPNGRYSLTAFAIGADGSATPIAAESFQLTPAPRPVNLFRGRFTRANGHANQARPGAVSASPQIGVARALVLSTPTTVGTIPAADAFGHAIQSLDTGRLNGIRKKPI